MLDLTCALSGVTATEDDYADTDDYVGDHTDLPEGWTKITVTMRRGNPAWEAVQEVKELTAMQLLSQIPDESRTPDVTGAVMLQIEAQFAALEARREYERTIVDTQTLYVAPAERVEGLDAEITSLCETLGIDAAMLLPEEEVEEAPEKAEDAPSEDAGEAPEAG